MEDGKPIDKWAALIIISVILAGSYLYVEDQKLQFQKDKATEKQELIENNKEERESCLATADENYFSTWESECKRLYHKKECALPIYLSDRIEKAQKQEKSDCIKMYPVQ